MRRWKYAPPPVKADLRIEYPSRGTTYARDEYGVYEYDVYPSSSVLAGQTRRRFLDSFETLEEAKAAYPTADVINGSCFAPPSLNHLPDEEDS